MYENLLKTGIPLQYIIYYTITPKYMLDVQKKDIKHIHNIKVLEQLPAYWKARLEHLFDANLNDVGEVNWQGVAELLDEGPFNVNYDYLLEKAVNSNNTDAVKVILSADRQHNYSIKYNTLQRLLHKSVINDNIDIANLIMSWDEIKKNITLFEQISKGYIKTAKFLLENTRITPEDLTDSLDQAYKKGYTNMIPILISKGANPENLLSHNSDMSFDIQNRIKGMILAYIVSIQHNNIFGPENIIVSDIPFNQKQHLSKPYGDRELYSKYLNVLIRYSNGNMVNSINILNAMCLFVNIKNNTKKNLLNAIKYILYDKTEISRASNVFFVFVGFLMLCWRIDLTDIIKLLYEIGSNKESTEMAACLIGAHLGFEILQKQIKSKTIIELVDHYYKKLT